VASPGISEERKKDFPAKAQRRKGRPSGSRRSELRVFASLRGKSLREPPNRVVRYSSRPFSFCPTGI